MNKTYMILRYTWQAETKVVERGLTLKQAQAHCNREDTQEKNSNGEVVWFDGYTEEK